MTLLFCPILFIDEIALKQNKMMRSIRCNLCQVDSCITLIANLSKCFRSTTHDKMIEHGNLLLNVLYVCFFMFSLP